MSFHLTNEQAAVLEHTSQNGKYVADPKGAEYREVILPMVRAGLMGDQGTLSFLDGMVWLTLTGLGRAALLAWRKAQPHPPRISKRKQRAQERWREFCCWRWAYGGTFREWLSYRKEVGA